MKKIKIIPIILFVFIVSIGSIIYFDYQKYSNKILPNISINGDNYSNLTRANAEKKLKNKVKYFREKRIDFVYKNITTNTQFEEIGAKIDIKETISNAFKYGHRNSILKNLEDLAKLQINDVNIPIVYEIDRKKLEKYIIENLSEIEDQPKNFGYRYEKGEFVSVPAQSGMIIDRNKLVKNISENIANLDNKKIYIKLINKNPEINEDKFGTALLHAHNLLAKKIILKYDSSVWKIQKDDFALWIKFDATDNFKLEVGLNKEKLKDYLLTLIPQINREPINAQLAFKGKKVKMFSLSQEGVSLQIKKSMDEIDKTIFRQENYSTNENREIEVQMITKKVQPEITTASIDNMGITSLLATGESNFARSPKNRIHNITVGAGRFQGVLVGPGDIFSFNKILGNVGPREGYLPELVIKKGATVPEYGGGLCQVSTTAFRAAVLAGLEITERKNHAYPVGYYNPQGTDATIYPPHPDLRFKNNTPAYILIQTRIEGNKLFFDFYGSNDKRKVKLIGPYTYDKKSDGSMKSIWTQQVYNKNGKLLFEKKFYSNYRSPSLYPHKNPLE